MHLLILMAFLSIFILPTIAVFLLRDRSFWRQLAAGTSSTLVGWFFFIYLLQEIAQQDILAG